jgi:uncharacterized protein with GYD domain
MPTYVTLVKWTEQGLRNVKGTLARVEQAGAAAEKSGGRMIGAWWTQGAYDLIAVFELPDDATASTLVLTTAMAGNIRSETLRAYTAEEMQRILQKLP